MYILSIQIDKPTFDRTVKVSSIFNVILFIILRHSIYLEYISKTLKWHLNLTTILVFAQVFNKTHDAILPIKYYNTLHLHIIMRGLNQG